MARKSKSTNGTTTVTETMTPATLMPAADTVELPVALIDADDRENARKSMDIDKVKELAKSIKRDGQLQPVGVYRKQDGRFGLIFGYRRFYAVSWAEAKGGLAKPTIKAVIREQDAKLSAKDMELNRRYDNLVENVVRDDLTPHDLAFACLELKLKYDQSPQKVANRFGKSGSYVGNLVRCAEKLHPDIIARWKAECEDPDGKVVKIRVCTTDQLNKWATLDDEEQLLAFRRLTGELPEEGEEEEEGEEGEQKGNLRAPMKEIKALLAAAEKVKKEPRNAEAQVKAEAIIEACRFVIGTADRVKGIYVRGQKDEERAEKAAEKAGKAKTK